MDIRTLRTIVFSLAVVALLPSAAHAASPAQIQRDAADGSIDGDYTLAEMRAADRSVSVEQREYYGWEDVYRDYVRGMSSAATAAPIAPARGGGAQARAVEPGSKSTARSDSTDSPTRSAVTRGEGAAPTPERAGGPDTTTESDDAADAPNATAAEITVDEAGAGFPLALVFAAIPLVVLAAGAWRPARRRFGSDRKRAAQGD